MNSTPAKRKSPSPSEALEQGRASFHRNAWTTAFAQLSAADLETPLKPVDLQWLAVSAYLIGREEFGGDILARAHQGFLADGDAQGAARSAFWLGFTLLNAGELAQASGWLARARRVLDDGRHDCVEQGYLLLPSGIQSIHKGDTDAAHEFFIQAAAIGQRFADRDLVTLARMGQGRALIRRGEVPQGISLLDEAMVAVTTSEVTPIVAGSVYCSVIEACNEVFDLRRAHEWTSALERWCASLPDIVPFRSHCLVRRAEILQLHGAWPEAFDQAQQARERLSQPPSKPAVGAAIYRIAELHRLRGDFAEAEQAYRQASQWQPKPRPGFAQLRLAQGQFDAANAAIRYVADQAQEPSGRSQVLDAFVEIVLAVNDLQAAGAAAGELSQIATRFNSPALHAISARARGSVLLAAQDSREALTALRQAFVLWRGLEAPYEAARVQILIALACRQQGNGDTASLELTSAREVFQQLGAAPDVARVDALLQRGESKAAGRLTAREVEVLGLIASGKTNRAIAGELGISEKTVARHVSNIFTKLDLPSRAAATAYAYQNGLA